MDDSTDSEPHDGVRPDGVFAVVVDGYDAVYPAVAASPTFRRVWAEHAYGGEFPEDYAHISFLTFDELRAMTTHLALDEDALLVDLACGAGGPGLWAASQAGAFLIGIDPSATGLAEARQRAERLGFAESARYEQGSFATTGLDDGAAGGVLSVDAIQYAPDKMAVFAEAHRILRPGGRLTFSAFEVEPDRVEGLPVLGVDPVADYAPLLAHARFAVDWYRQSDGWIERVAATFNAVIDAMPTLTDEMGEAASSSLATEASLTLQYQPYRRRVLVAAHRVED